MLHLLPLFALNTAENSDLPLPIPDFDSAGYATNGYTLSNWTPHGSDRIYQGGPTYTAADLHDTTFNEWSTLDDSSNNGWAHAVIDPLSVDPWIGNVGKGIY